MPIRSKRVYDPPSPDDGRRILIDRLWPRGLTKDAARIDLWLKTIAPSAELRKWYGHDPQKWPEFRTRYFAELDANPDAVDVLRKELGRGPVTLVFGSKEERLNNAAALVEFLSRKP